MAEHRAAWEVRTTDVSFGFVLWLGGRQLHCALDTKLRNLFRGWLAEHLGKTEDREVQLEQVHKFVMDIVPRRLTGVSVLAVDPDRLPAEHAWLTALENDRIPRLGEWDRDGWRSNRWDPDTQVTELLEGTRVGRYRWGRSAHGGFKGGGRDPDALEMWLTLAYCGGPYALVIRRRRELVGGPIVQQDGWMSRSDLHRLWDLLERSS